MINWRRNLPKGTPNRGGTIAIPSTTHRSPSSVGRLEKTQGWFETNATEISFVIKRKCRARSEVQQTARSYANKYWLELCEGVQLDDDTSNIGGVYDGIKKATGPTYSKMGPLKSAFGETITDKRKQIERWVEHNSDLYSRETIISNTTLESVERLPVMKKLDKMPSLEELSKATDSLPTGKAPGLDGTPAAVIKSGKRPHLSHIYKLLCQCWEGGAVPQDMRDCNITLYKNKGDCNNYRGISLLSMWENSLLEWF